MTNASTLTEANSGQSKLRQRHGDARPVRAIGEQRKDIGVSRCFSLRGVLYVFHANHGGSLRRRRRDVT